MRVEIGSKGVRGAGLRLLGLGLVLGFSVACGGGFEPDPAHYFVEDWSGAYEKRSNCVESMAGHSGHVEVWVSDSGKAAVEDKESTPAEGAVILKTQYDNPECSGDPNTYTVMKWEGESWSWQNVDGDGAIVQQGKGEEVSYCASCHQGCSNGICTP